MPPRRDGYRDEARRRMAEARRAAQGLPAGDRAEHRAELPALPAPAVVLHVAPRGDDAAGGTRGRAAGDARRRAQRRPEAARGPRRRTAGGRSAGRRPRRDVSRRRHVRPGGGGFRHRRGADRLPGGARRDADLGRRRAHRLLAADLGRSDQGATRSRGPRARARGGPRRARRPRFRRCDRPAPRPELFIDGVPQTLARWPDEGFVATGEILGTDTFKVWGSIQGCRDGKFKYVEDRPSTWVDEPDVRLYGYWFWDWYEEFQKVAAIDAGTRAFTLAKPYSQYGYRQGQRYRAVNVLRELDRPGEWYLDRRSGRLYWLPPEGDAWTRAVATVSVCARPFVQLENVEHVILAGLTIEDGRGDGIHVRGGAHCVIAGCTLRRLGGDAIVVQGGQRHTVFGCTLHTLGCGGARVAGGDRTTLAAGGHVVENCTVADIARLKRTYAPAVHLDGCGNRIAHNRFERIPSSALRIEGNDHVIELNAIRHVVQESDDQGGLDMFGNPLYRGVVIRWNRWSDITGGTHCGAAGVRLDDMISGVTVHGNVFERCGAVQFGGVQIHGGKENVVDNNLFVDCFAGLSFSRWGEKRWRESIAQVPAGRRRGAVRGALPRPGAAGRRRGHQLGDAQRVRALRDGVLARRRHPARGAQRVARRPVRCARHGGRRGDRPRSASGGHPRGADPVG